MLTSQPPGHYTYRISDNLNKYVSYIIYFMGTDSVTFVRWLEADDVHISSENILIKLTKIDEMRGKNGRKQIQIRSGNLLG
jgi:hypothetical protein